MFALVFEGFVKQIEAAPFPVHSALEWVDITGVIPAPEVGWTYDGVNFTAPVIPPKPPFVPSIQDDLLVLSQTVSSVGEKEDAQARLDAQPKPGTV